MTLATLGRATKWAEPGKVPPHRPVHTVEVSTCGTCGYIIGWSPDLDPVHAVEGECRCGAGVGPFRYECRNCEAERAERAESERQARLATYRWEDPVEGADTDERPRPNRDHADPFEGDPERKRLHQEAVEYIRTYTGRFALILDLRANPRWGTKWFRLSDKQVEAVLKSKAREAEWERARREAETDRVVNAETGRDLTVLPYGRTRAAVENESGTLTFLLIDRPKADSKWHGWVFVKQQQGPTEVKLGAQRPGATYIGQWPSLIDKVLADPLTAVRRYGLELGECGVCGLPLTNDESRREGIGPVCRSRLTA